MFVYKVLRIVIPNAFQELFNEINSRMRRGIKRLRERDVTICKEAESILNNIHESETMFLISVLTRTRKTRVINLQISN